MRNFKFHSEQTEKCKPACHCFEHKNKPPDTRKPAQKKKTNTPRKHQLLQLADDFGSHQQWQHRRREANGRDLRGGCSGRIRRGRLLGQRSKVGAVRIGVIVHWKRVNTWMRKKRHKKHVRFIIIDKTKHILVYVENICASSPKLTCLQRSGASHEYERIILQQALPVGTMHPITPATGRAPLKWQPVRQTLSLRQSAYIVRCAHVRWLLKLFTTHLHAGWLAACCCAENCSNM